MTIGFNRPHLAGNEIEYMLQALEKNRKAGFTIYKPRLPRLGTDQTATFLPVKNADPAPVMLEHLRAFRVM